jgi:hypothetical protein
LKDKNMKLSNPYALTLSNPRRKKRTKARRRSTRRRRAAAPVAHKTTKRKNRRNPMRRSNIKHGLQSALYPVAGFYASNIISKMLKTTVMAKVPVLGTSPMLGALASRVASVFAVRALSKKFGGSAMADGAMVHALVATVQDLAASMPAGVKDYLSIGEDGAMEVDSLITGDEAEDAAALVGADLIGEDEDEDIGADDASFAPVGAELVGEDEDEDISGDGFSPVGG